MMRKRSRDDENKLCSRLTVARVVSKGDIEPHWSPPEGQVYPISKKTCRKEALVDQESGIAMTYATLENRESGSTTELASELMEALFQEALRKGGEYALAVHACPLSSDPGGLRKEAVDELRNAKVVRAVVTEWAENEGLGFMEGMNQDLHVENVMTTAKQLIKLDPVDRRAPQQAFWRDFDACKFPKEPSAKSFSALMASYLDANETVHRPLTRLQLGEVRRALSARSDTFGLNSISTLWFDYMLKELLGSGRVV